MKNKVYILIGPPCSGKGTQGKLLAKKIENLEHISAGEILREKYPEDTFIGKQLLAGEMVATDIICDTLIEKINDSEKDCLIDGFPRTEEQAFFLREAVIKKKIEIEKIFVLSSALENLIDRMKKRTMCFLCQSTFPDFIECCGEKTRKRNDDNLEIFKVRMKAYQNPINNILKILSGPIYFINGDSSIEEINKNIINIISN